MNEIFDKVKGDPGADRDGSCVAGAPEWGPWYAVKVYEDGQIGEDNT